MNKEKLPYFQKENAPTVSLNSLPPRDKHRLKSSFDIVSLAAESHPYCLSILLITIIARPQPVVWDAQGESSSVRVPHLRKLSATEEILDKQFFSGDV